MFIDYRYFNTAQDILGRFNMKSCILKLYNEHDQEMKPQEIVSEMREYIVKRHDCLFPIPNVKDNSGSEKQNFVTEKCFFGGMK